jgi:extradiol dioxygenase family protein
VRHFGVVLEWGAFERLRTKLEQAPMSFRIAPRIRFEGEVGEQATMFFDDPSGNCLEFKAFRDPSLLFAKRS